MCDKNLFFCEARLMANDEREARGPGQPPKGDRARTAVVNVRFTQAEREQVEAVARDRGETVSAYVRGVVLRSAGRGRSR